MPTMKAVGLTRYLPIEDPAALADIEAPRPDPGPRDLLVRVEAVSVNPVDVKVRAPKDKVEAHPRILGWDASGVVEAVGEAVTLFRPGDNVFYAGDITRPGSNAEYQLVDERIAGRKPAALSHAEAAALPLTAITAWEVLFDRLKLDPDGANAGETILLIGGAGGVGSITIQLAHRAGLTVIATASRPETKDWVRDLGADHVISHREPLRPQVETLGFDNVDHIAIFNDTDGHWKACADLIRPQGTIVTIVENSRPLDLEPLKAKSAAFAWEFMFTRPMYGTPDMIEQNRLLNRVSDAIDNGFLRTTVTDILSPIDAATLREAHRRIETGATRGKLVVARIPSQPPGQPPSH